MRLEEDVFSTCAETLKVLGVIELDSFTPKGPKDPKGTVGGFNLVMVLQIISDHFEIKSHRDLGIRNNL